MALPPAPVLIRPQWPAPTAVHAACTTRAGGFGVAPYDTLNLALHVGDDADTVRANRAHLHRCLQLPSEPAWLDQVHGCRVLALPDAGASRQADAAWTAQASVVCTVMTADCLPILFCDESASCVAVAHAGWRGLADGVLEATVAALPVPAARLMAWIGPAIGPSAFEVGAEVRERFVLQSAQAAAAFTVAGRAGKLFGDLPLLARQRLAAVGVHRVYGGDHCTVSDPARFFSFRRDGRCGRMASLIWIGPGSVSSRC